MKRALLKCFCLLAVATLWLPQVVFAVPIFSEIMYDLENGSDSGREWIEVQNVGPLPADLALYKLFESGTNHDIKFISGKSALGVGEFGVVASNPKKFLLDYPSFSGNLFDSAFSLSNSGESLILRDSKLKDVDFVTYSSAQGGSGNGNSMQKNTAGLWIENVSTPGSVNTNVASVPTPKIEVVQTPLPQNPIVNKVLSEKIAKESTIKSKRDTVRNQLASIPVVTRSNVSQTSQSLVAENKQTATSSNLTIWIVALVMVIGTAILGFLLVNQAPKEVPKEVDEADTYEII